MAIINPILKPTFICGWCRNSFKEKITKDKYDDRSLLICPNCGHLLPSSRKESTGKLESRKHIHIEWKNGDVII
jgi:transcription elongation factor Elf1